MLDVDGVGVFSYLDYVHKRERNQQRRVRSGSDPEGPPSDAPPSEDRLKSMRYDLLDY